MKRWLLCKILRWHSWKPTSPQDFWRTRMNWQCSLCGMRVRYWKDIPKRRIDAY